MMNLQIKELPLPHFTGSLDSKYRWQWPVPHNRFGGCLLSKPGIYKEERLYPPEDHSGSSLFSRRRYQEITLTGDDLPKFFSAKFSS